MAKENPTKGVLTVYRNKRPKLNTSQVKKNPQDPGIREKKKKTPSTFTGARPEPATGEEKQDKRKSESGNHSRDLTHRKEKKEGRPIEGSGRKKSIKRRSVGKAKLSGGERCRRHVS